MKTEVIALLFSEGIDLGLLLENRRRVATARINDYSYQDWSG